MSSLETRSSPATKPRDQVQRRRTPAIVPAKVNSGLRAAAPLSRDAGPAVKVMTMH